MSGTPDVWQAPEADHLLLRQLEAHLHLLPFPALCDLARLLLGRCGYSSVRALGATGGGAPRNWSGEGGLDLLAISHTDLATFLTGVGIKTGRVPVSRRVVDEMRGALGRAGADQGLLLATSTFSAKTREVARTPGLTPVRLFDGQALAGMLLERRIGVRRQGEEWTFDGLFFERLEEQAQGSLTAQRPRP